MGIEMVPVKMNDDGPDMNEVYNIACSDPSVKGMWCVPKFSNPEGITYSDEVVEQIAMMKPAAPDFRIFWDNAYVVHELYDENVPLANIFELAKQYGTEDNIFYFASTSKITFPGSGLAIMAASDKNLEQIRPIIATQTIGYDKINQMRHVKLFIYAVKMTVVHSDKRPHRYSLGSDNAVFYYPVAAVELYSP